MFISDDEVVLRMLDENMIIPLAAITVGGLIAIISIIFSLVRSMVVGKERERTKREIAAYVAEGSIDADKAVAILEADKPVWEKCRTGSRRQA